MSNINSNLKASNLQTIQEINSINLVDYNIETFILAVELLYRAKEPEVKRKADNYLRDFEKSTEAWDISINILNSDNMADEAYFDASQIIKKKLKYDFADLCSNETIINKLAEFLINKIITFKDQKYYLYSNICQCFALFTIFAHQKINDLIIVAVQKLNNENIKSLSALVLIFNYLMENAFDEDIVIDENYRDTYEVLLQNISNDVVMFIDYIIKYINTNKDKIISADPLSLSFFRLLNKDVK